MSFDNVCCSYVVTGSSFFVYCYEIVLKFCSVNYRVIYFENCSILRVWCVARVNESSIILISRISIIWIVSIPIVGIISIDIIWRTTKSIIWIISISWLRMGTGIKRKFRSIWIWSWIVILVLSISTIWSTLSVSWEISWYSLIWWSSSIIRFLRWLLSRVIWVLWKWFSLTFFYYEYFCWVNFDLFSCTDELV